MFGVRIPIENISNQMFCLVLLYLFFFFQKANKSLSTESKFDVFLSHGLMVSRTRERVFNFTVQGTSKAALAAITANS